MSSPINDGDSFKLPSNIDATPILLSFLKENRQAILDAHNAEFIKLKAQHKVAMEKKHEDFIKKQDDMIAQIQQLEREKSQQKDRIRALMWRIEQIRASAQVAVDSALARAQSALNEGAVTRLKLIGKEQEILDLEEELKELRAVVEQQEPTLTRGEKEAEQFK